MYKHVVMKNSTEANALIVLETRVKTKDELHPVKLRVIYNRKAKNYILKYPKLTEPGFEDLFGKTIYMSAKNFKKTEGSKPRKPFDTFQIIFSGFRLRALNEISKLNPFNFEAFEEKFFDKPKDDQDLFSAITSKATILRKDAKFNTATILEALLTSLKGFTGKDKYPFGNITVNKLKEFENWMLTPRVIEWKTKDGKTKSRTKKSSKTTVSIYIRALQAIFNESAPEGVPYPFGKGKYTIPNWSHNKRAITQADVAKIAGYKAKDGSMEIRSRDLWLFSYLCNGINFKDIANLKYSNIHEDTIVFERAKTAKSRDENSEITVIITHQIGRILDMWGNKPALKDEYIFPILHNGMKSEDQHHAIKQMIKNTNKYMKTVCSDIEIPEVTTYVARHSFATVLKRSGASVEFISESLGHKSISTTQNYLANFEIDEKRKWAEKLLPGDQT